MKKGGRISGTLEFWCFILRMHILSRGKWFLNGLYENEYVATHCKVLQYQ